MIFIAYRVADTSGGLSDDRRARPGRNRPSDALVQQHLEGDRVLDADGVTRHQDYS
ncbi:MAG TPA: hypothetical protein VGO74_12765 [Modestobacter sp.]|nr:hypothetical protein [Modestobacter sp.]